MAIAQVRMSVECRSILEVPDTAACAMGPEMRSCKATSTAMLWGGRFNSLAPMRPFRSPGDRNADARSGTSRRSIARSMMRGAAPADAYTERLERALAVCASEPGCCFAAVVPQRCTVRRPAAGRWQSGSTSWQCYVTRTLVESPARRNEPGTHSHHRRPMSHDHTRSLVHGVREPPPHLPSDYETTGMGRLRREAYGRMLGNGRCTRSGGLPAIAVGRADRVIDIEEHS